MEFEASVISTSFLNHWYSIVSGSPLLSLTDVVSVWPTDVKPEIVTVPVTLSARDIIDVSVDVIFSLKPLLFLSPF